MEEMPISTSSHQQLPTQYRCELCGYLSKIRGKLEAHWKSGCYYSNLDRKHDDLNDFQCAACGFRDQSKKEIQLHFSVCQKRRAITWWNQDTVNVANWKCFCLLSNDLFYIEFTATKFKFWFDKQKNWNRAIRRYYS